MKRENCFWCTFCEDTEHLTNFVDAAGVSKQISFEFCAKISILRPGTEFDMLQHTTIIVVIFLTKIRWLKCYTAGGKPWKMLQGNVGFVCW